MMIFLFAALCIVGVIYLFWQLIDSERVTTDKLRTRLAEEASPQPAEPRA